MPDKFKSHKKSFGGSDADWELLLEAVDVLGFDQQSLKAVEETSELGAAMMQYILGKKEKEDVITEIADVIIMMRQLCIYFGVAEVAAEIDVKMQKVQNKVEKNRR